MINHKSLRTWGSSPTVGSSNNTSLGELMNARPRRSRRRMPPERLVTRSLARSVSCAVSSALEIAVFRCARGTRQSAAHRARFYRAVCWSSMLSCCGHTPKTERAERLCVAMSKSSTEIDPPFSPVCPVIIRIKVVFPAPFGPSSPRQVPGITSRDKSFTATNSPKRLVACRIDSAGDDGTCSG